NLCRRICGKCALEQFRTAESNAKEPPGVRLFGRAHFFLETGRIPDRPIVFFPRSRIVRIKLYPFEPVVINNECVVERQQLKAGRQRKNIKLIYITDERQVYSAAEI